MGSKVVLKNSVNAEFTIEHSGSLLGKRINATDIVVAVDEITDFPQNPLDGDVCIVRNTSRGGTFIYDATQSAVNNGGTIFDGWVRQFSGAVNVKWFGAKGDGITDDTIAIQNAIDTLLGVFIPKGTYYCTQTIEMKDNSLQGELYRLDTESGQSTIYSSANPIMKVNPYPGTIINNIKIKGAGTTASIELYDVSSYSKQVGILAGRTNNFMTIASGDNYNFGGSGGLYMENVTFSNINGWGFYAYKLYGQSVLNNLFFFNVGHSTDTNSGGMIFTGECVDTTISNVHLIPHSATAATAIQLGTSKTASDLLNRFYVPVAHLRFSNIFSEGYSQSVREYTGVNCHFINCHFSFGTIKIGEVPIVYYGNISTVFTNCGYFKASNIYIEGPYDVSFMNNKAETNTIVNYTGSNLTLFKNSGFSYNPNYTSEKSLVKNAEESSAINNLCAGFIFGSWTITGGTAAVNQINSDIDRLVSRNSGQQPVVFYNEISGLVPNSIITVMYAIEVSYSAYVTDMRCLAYDSSGNTIKSINYPGSGNIASGTPRVTITTNIKVPSDGIIRIGYSAGSTNTQRYFNPVVVYGLYETILDDNGININDSYIYGNMVFNDRKIFFSSSAPTNRTWRKGDIAYANSPSAGGSIGWVCTIAGTPGTWKAFGKIDD